VDTARSSAPSSPPSIFRAVEHRSAEKQIAPTPDDVWRTGQPVPIERWIFGQLNRLLPAKASCRAIANLAATNGKRKPDELASAIAKEASALGAYLRHLDEAENRGRDETFSTAFPGAGLSAEKGILRYANQFVVSTNSNDQLSGLLVSLKFINRVKGPRSPIGLTEAGWTFAALGNPILDQSSAPIQDRFSDEEKDFLLTHIANHVPAERFAYRSILEAIQTGSNSPDALDEALSKYRSKSDHGEPSSSFLSSQRSGAVSRMSDLGMIERCRSGVRVEYAVTEIGKKFLATTSTLEGE